MAKITLLLIVGLGVGIIAKPYENDKDSYISNIDSSSERLVDNYLIELYERILHIRPSKRPEVEDHLEKDDHSINDFRAPEAIADAIPLTAPTKQEDRPSEKDLLTADDPADKKAKVDKTVEKQTNRKQDGLKPPAPRAEKPQPLESDASRLGPKPKVEGKEGDKMEKHGKHPERDVGKLNNNEKAPAKPLPLVQINVNVGKK